MSNKGKKKGKETPLISKFPPPTPTTVSRSSPNIPTPEEIASKNIKASTEYVQKGIESTKDTKARTMAVKTFAEIQERKSVLNKPKQVRQPDYSSVAFKTQIEETGLKFQIGKLCRPNSADLTYALNILVDAGMLEPDLFGDYFDVAQLFGSESYQWRRQYVHQILRTLGVSYDPTNGWQYPYKPEDIKGREARILAVIWLLMCWDWVVNPGKRPEPKMPGIHNSKTHIRTAVKVLSCPFCGKRFTEPPTRTPMPVRMYKFRYWLKTHAYEYHKWDYNPMRKIRVPRKFHRVSRKED